MRAEARGEALLRRFGADDDVGHEDVAAERVAT
jgi:hypothetical protein